MTIRPDQMIVIDTTGAETVYWVVTVPTKQEPMNDNHCRNHTAHPARGQSLEQPKHNNRDAISI